jgi:hypothetical protein
MAAFLYDDSVDGPSPSPLLRLQPIPLSRARYQLLSGPRGPLRPALPTSVLVTSYEPSNFGADRPSVHIIVPEGLACEPGEPEAACLLSDYYEAVLQRVVREAPNRAIVYVSPANTFGCPLSEEEYGARYLNRERSDLRVEIPTYVRDRLYLDTFDNARVLREWLEGEGRWPLRERVTLYCNAPHTLRSLLLFTLCGFDIARVVRCRPEAVRRLIVRRLWFYDYPLVQIAYEALGIAYGLARWIVWRWTRERNAPR